MNVLLKVKLLTLTKTLHNLAFYIDNNDNDMTFVVHIIYLWPL